MSAPTLSATPDTSYVQPSLGDYFVTRTSGPPLDRLAAWFIRWWTARRNSQRVWKSSDVNHAGTFVGPTMEFPEGAIVEAVRRVRFNSVNAYPDATWSTGRLPAHLTPNAEQRVRIASSARLMVGDRYNEVDLLAVGLAQPRAGDLVTSNTWWAKRLDHDSREICSQLVDQAYLDAGIHLFADGRLAGLVAPQDLEEILLPAS
jgi:hypothetical protein